MTPQAVEALVRYAPNPRLRLRPLPGRVAMFLAFFFIAASFVKLPSERDFYGALFMFDLVAYALTWPEVVRPYPRPLRDCGGAG